jgi:hypothetical protein
MNSWKENKKTYAMKKYIKPSENNILESLVGAPFVPPRIGVQASLYAERHNTTKSKHIE